MENKEKLSREEMSKIAVKAIDELEQETKVEDMVKDNMIKFEIDKIKYRVRQPELDEKKEMFKARRIKYLEMIKDKTFLFKKDWVNLYKEKGIDIKKMEKELKTTQTTLEKVAIELAQIKDKSSVEKLKKEIIALKDRMYSIAEEKADLLSYSIEDQLMVFATSYICYLVFEKLVGEVWTKCFANYQEFEKTDNEATTNALSVINYIIYRAV